MGEFLVFLAVVLGFAMVAGPVLAIIALVRGEKLRKRVADLETALRLGELAVPPPPPRPAAAVPAIAVPPAVVAPAPPPPIPRPAPAAQEMPPPPPQVRVLPPPPPPRRDFATNLGPKLLVATGALAFVVFLGLFVKYAWENDWVGPTGRVLSGALMGLALLAGGVRLLGREYRPLGQGLAGAGLASLYVSAFGAHGFYQLISWQGAGILMLAITTSAVLLALKLDARLLAALAWVGGYLTPVLLAPGEDLALALFAYLAFLDVGAMMLDRRKPWLETAPLAMLGTLLLYTAWYAQFFRAERFGVAAFGIVLFTGLFAAGMARKERGPALAVVLAIAAVGVSVLAGSADRPVWILLLSMALAVAALFFASSLGSLFAVIGSVAFVLPLLVWSLAHFRPEAFGLAAGWVLLGLLLFTLWKREGCPDVLRAAVLVVGGLFSVGMAAGANRPVALMLFLLAQAGVAILVRRSWDWAEAIGIVMAFASALAWFNAFYKLEEASHALALALPVAGVYLGSLVIRNLVLGWGLARADLVSHIANATFVWTILYRVLYSTDARTLGLASVALAVLYLGIGLAGLRKELADPSNVRTCLGLAAVFLTLAIPVQLGLHGITLAWALEGALLLWLGARFASWRTRVGAYAVLALAVLRLFARHFPLHGSEPFAPVMNPAFGTWLFVIACLGVGVLLVSRAGLAGEQPDSVLAPATAVSGLLLLFLLLTWETRGTFISAAREALATGNRAAAEQAAFQGGLAVSVLWTIFATGLLAAGLAARNRPLFYAAYGLFAFTSIKVVFVDLATLQTLYRMLSFLALALLLLAGAYLNLRFRARLLPQEAET